jgi:Fe-S-cluster containining protein
VPPPAGPRTSTSRDVQEIAANVERGFLNTHTQLSQSGSEVLKVAAQITGLARLLVDKGVLSAEEVDASIGKAAEELKQQPTGLRFALLSGRPDKYKVVSPEVDCAARVKHCKSACCGLDVVLSPQDVEEGVVRWDLAYPYQIRHSKQDGYCCHMKRDTGFCEVYEKRPYICRTYSCANDKRIWLDFDKMIPNTESLARLFSRPDEMHLTARDMNVEISVPSASSVEPADATAASDTDK